METKQNTLAAVIGAIVILLIFITASFFVGQKIKENFSKTKTIPASTATEDTTTNNTNLLENKKNPPSAKVKTIPSTGPESLGLLFLPTAGVAGVYLKFLASKRSK